MKISILVQTAEFRGDHAADVALPLTPIEGETVEQLVERSRIGKRQYAAGEVIEIRLMLDEPSC